jgi:hypothetical protein
MESPAGPLAWLQGWVEPSEATGDLSVFRKTTSLPVCPERYSTLTPWLKVSPLQLIEFTPVLTVHPTRLCYPRPPSHRVTRPAADWETQHA